MEKKFFVLELGSRSEVETTFFLDDEKSLSKFVEEKKKEVYEEEFYYLNEKSWGFDLGIGEELSYLIVRTDSKLIKNFDSFDEECGCDLWEDEEFEEFVELCYDTE